MINFIRQNLKSQKGFTLVELMVVVAILGILASIAIPRLSNSTASANTAKAAADLRTIDSAISMYLANDTTGVAPSSTNLVDKGYLAVWPKKPTGTQVYMGYKDPQTAPTDDYSISEATPYRAVWGTKHAEDFYKGTAVVPTAPSGS